MKRLKTILVASMITLVPTILMWLLLSTAFILGQTDEKLRHMNETARSINRTMQGINEDLKKSNARLEKFSEELEAKP